MDGFVWMDLLNLVNRAKRLLLNSLVFVVQANEFNDVGGVEFMRRCIHPHVTFSIIQK